MSGSAAAFAGCSSNGAYTPTSILSSASSRVVPSSSVLSIPAGHTAQTVFTSAYPGQIHFVSSSNGGRVANTASNTPLSVTGARLVSPIVEQFSKYGRIITCYNFVVDTSQESIEFYLDPGGYFFSIRTGSYWGQWSIGPVVGNDGNVWISAVKIVANAESPLPGAFTAPARTAPRHPSLARPATEACSGIGGAIGGGAIAALTTLSGAAALDLGLVVGGAVGAAVGAAVGTAIGPEGTLVGAYFGEAIGQQYGAWTLEAMTAAMAPAVAAVAGGLLGLAVTSLCNEITQIPAAAGAGNVTTTAYGDQVWATAGGAPLSDGTGGYPVTGHWTSFTPL